MPTFDGGHCFLTALLPIKTAEIVDHQGLRSSPVHMVRDALAVLPTAHQSQVTAKLPTISPFVRNRNTHFVRFVVIDDVVYNGRVPTDAILDQSDRTIGQEIDRLPGPYLLFSADFDAPNGTVEELRAWLGDIWSKMRDDLDPVLAQCHGYPGKAATAAGFADYITRCQVETTMPFNDYWPNKPPLTALSKGLLLGALAATAVVVDAALFWLLGHFGWLDFSWLANLGFAAAAVAALVYAGCSLVLWEKGQLPGWRLVGWLIIGAVLFWLFNHFGWRLSWLSWVEGVGIAGVALAAGVYVAYSLVMRHGAKPFPMAPNSDLPSVLKALYLQRRMIGFALAMQGKPDDELYRRFGEFVQEHKPADTASPAQEPGIIPV
jgi:hypothetical protein